MAPDHLRPYPDGRWWVVDHRVSPDFPLNCRGNVGEVYPNVVTPLTGSIVMAPLARGQQGVFMDLGMMSGRQLAQLEEAGSALTPVVGGYLYGNVSLARSAVARTPGLTVEMVDHQMFGLSGAPAHVRGKGERSPRAALRSVRVLARGLLRPRGDRLAEDQALVARHVAALTAITTASEDELLALPRTAAPLFERMMYSLLWASAFAGVGRSMLERIVVDLGDDDLVNQLTAGLGTIESAAPAAGMWQLGRLVAADAELTAAFDAGLDRLDARLRDSGASATRQYVERFDAFRIEHGSRGPDEWELASPTWGSDPSIALAVVDRLRHSPPDWDPMVTAGRLATERQRALDRTRDVPPRRTRWMFDKAWRATAMYQAQREATKAAFVRALEPTRRALAELARRSEFTHHDFFLLTIDELPAALAAPSSVASTIAERRARRDYLQARVPPFWFQGAMPPPSTWTRRAEQRQPDPNARTLHGLGVCSGRATGTARVVTDPTDPGDIGPTDVLVAPITDPAWTPLFLAVAGVVVDVGAQQSHAAIVARELGIPTVVSVTGASTTIPDGALVTVDGSAGTVHVHGTADLMDSAAGGRPPASPGRG